MATIACVDLDPLLVDMVRRVRPSDEVVQVDASDLPTSRPVRWGALVVPAESPAINQLDGTPLMDRTVVIGVSRLSHPGPSLRRPVDGADLRVALSRVLGPPGRVPGLRASLGDLPQSVGAPGLLVVARAATMTAAIVLDATSEPGIAVPWAVGVILLWAALRVPVSRLSVPLVALDVVVAAIVLSVTGGVTSPYLLVAAVVAAEVGYTFPTRLGPILVGTAALAGVGQLAVLLAQGRAQPLDLIAFGSLIPLASLAGVLGARIARSHDGDHLGTLRQLNETLDRLSRQAQEMAGSLSMVTVSEAVLDTLREEFAATAAILLLDEGEPSHVRVVAGSFGLTSPPPIRLVDDSRGSRSVPSELAGLLPPGERLVAPVVSGAVERGCLVVIVPPDQRARGRGRQLADLASETALALDNARVFEGIRSLTLDEERGRLARDLHDGVIQSLVHVGFELELLANNLDDAARDDLTRLRKVVGQTVEEVRGTVQDLRSVRLMDGLGAALQALARDHRTQGVAVQADTAPVSGLTPEAELQLLRIAQEAVSNAIQHATPSRVDLLFWSSDHGVHLQVSDDGTGVDPSGPGSLPGRGVGLRAMKERADLLGAVLTVEPGTQVGTCVRVDVPWERVRP